MAVAVLFEKASGRILSSLTQEKIRDACETFTAERVRKAISIADDNGSTSWAYVEGVLRKGGDQKRDRKEAAAKGAPLLPPGHPCHGRKKGEQWEDDDGTKHVIGDDGWWYAKRLDAEPDKKEKVA